MHFNTIIYQLTMEKKPNYNLNKLSKKKVMMIVLNLVGPTAFGSFVRVNFFLLKLSFIDKNENDITWPNWGINI